MHAVVMDELEGYVAGTLEPAVQREIDAHLSVCRVCRDEIRSMQEISQLFTSLKSDEAIEPSLGFYADVVRNIGERETAPSLGGLLALNFAFGRRLVFASLLTLAVVGSFLVVRESGYRNGPLPETVMAQQNSPAFDTASAQDAMLVTLTAYEQR